jgi:prophage regulatory protein
MTTILRLPTVKERTGLSRSSIYAFVARGTFPAPVSLGARAVGWNSEAVDAWEEGRGHVAGCPRESGDVHRTSRRNPPRRKVWQNFASHAARFESR